jgi:hypothetical protein
MRLLAFLFSIVVLFVLADQSAAVERASTPPGGPGAGSMGAG